MKKLVSILIMVTALCVCAITPAMAEEESSTLTPTADFDLTFNSKYVWRGMLLVDGWVAQPSVTAGVGGFSVNVWGDYNITDTNDKEKNFDEIDITLDYTFSISDFSIPLGVIIYTFPNGPTDTTEAYLGVSYDWIVTPSITAYADVDQVSGSIYVLAALDYSYEVPEFSDLVSAGIGVGASIGWGNSDYCKGYFGVDESHIADWSAYLNVPIGIGPYFTVTPAVTYTALVDSEIRDAGKAVYSEESNWYFGVSLTLSF